MCYLSLEPTHCAHFPLARHGKQPWREEKGARQVETWDEVGGLRRDKDEENNEEQ